MRNAKPSGPARYRNGRALCVHAAVLAVCAVGFRSQPAQAQSRSTLPFEIAFKIVDADQNLPLANARLTLLAASTLDTLAKDLVADASGAISTTIDVAFSSGVSPSYWVDAAYPNPVAADHDGITIQYAYFGDSRAEPTIEVFDILGRKMNITTVLPAGLYLYRLRLPNGVPTGAQSIILSAARHPAIRLVPLLRQSIDFLPIERGVHDLHVDAIALIESANYPPSERVISLSAADPNRKQLTISRRDSPAKLRAEVASPNGRIALTLNIRDDGDAENCIFYRVSVDGKPVVLDSRLGLAVRSRQPLGCDLVIADTARMSVSETWKPLYGERRQIPNVFNALSVEFKDPASRQQRLRIEARSFDEGVAFRYVVDEIDGAGPLVVTDEATQLHFPDGTIGYAQYWAQGDYKRTLIRKISDGCRHPLTVEYPDGRAATFTEAGVRDYARMNLNRAREGGLKAALVGGVPVNQTPFVTPWRVFIIGDAPGDLLEHNYLLQNLSPPNELDDTSWIRPGTAVRVLSLMTQPALGVVDFANERKIDYVHFDAGWYGDPYSDLSDATTPRPDLDIERVVEYAADRDIGVFLYVDRRALERQLDDILAQFQRWGVKGLKAGFVNTDSQWWNVWLVDLVRKAADHKLMVDVHDSYVPTGLSRTLPNLLTQEGVRGNEEMPSAGHNVTLPFTRFVAGAADYTIVYFDNRIQTSRAHQLALPIVYYSPLQFLFWYDWPDTYNGEPELELWEDLPTVWDDTRVLNGKVGEYVTVARRSGDEWYVGSLTNELGRTLDLRLDFLDTGKTYHALIYADDFTSAGNLASPEVLNRSVDSSSHLNLDLAGRGGQAIHFVPVVAEGAADRDP